MEAVLQAPVFMPWQESDSGPDPHGDYSPEIQAWQREGYQALGLAMLRQAILDSRYPGETGEEARAWLAGEGLAWCELLGIGVQPGRWRAWVAAGCPKQTRVGQNLTKPNKNEVKK
jgi:hypothetical protein